MMKYTFFMILCKNRTPLQLFYFLYKMQRNNNKQLTNKQLGISKDKEWMIL